MDLGVFIIFLLYIGGLVFSLAVVAIAWEGIRLVERWRRDRRGAWAERRISHYRLKERS